MQILECQGVRQAMCSPAELVLSHSSQPHSLCQIVKVSIGCRHYFSESERVGRAKFAMHCYADCAVKGSCEPKLFLAVQLPAKLRVYTLVVSPFAGCPVPLKVAFWVPARIDAVQHPALPVCMLARLHSPVTQSYALTRCLIFYSGGLQG